MDGCESVGSVTVLLPPTTVQLKPVELCELTSGTNVVEGQVERRAIFGRMEVVLNTENVSTIVCGPQ